MWKYFSFYVKSESFKLVAAKKLVLIKRQGLTFISEEFVSGKEENLLNYLLISIGGLWEILGWWVWLWCISVFEFPNYSVLHHNFTYRNIHNQVHNNKLLKQFKDSKFSTFSKVFKFIYISMLAPLLQSFIFF